MNDDEIWKNVQQSKRNGNCQVAVTTKHGAQSQNYKYH